MGMHEESCKLRADSKREWKKALELSTSLQLKDSWQTNPTALYLLSAPPPREEAHEVVTEAQGRLCRLEHLIVVWVEQQSLQMKKYGQCCLRLQM